MLTWLALSPDQRKTIITSIAARSGFPEKAVEKDWWVTMVLKALFQTPYTNNLLFKGGTSLSKAWKLIERFGRY
jgi:predicted nucleotidyltransferase component of viral defense system